MKCMTVRESLENGVTAEKLIEDLRNEIMRAQREIDKSKAVEAKKLAEAREMLVRSAIAYIEQLGVVKKDEFTEKDIAVFCKLVAEAEAETKAEVAKVIEFSKLLNGSGGSTTLLREKKDLNEILKELSKTM